MNTRLVLSSLVGVNKKYVAISKEMLLYYREWPIDEFVLTLNGSESDIWYFRQFLRQAELPATIFTATSAYDNRKQARWSNQRQAYICEHYSTQDWKLCVDSDEILEGRDALLQLLETTACSYFLAFTVDMLPASPTADTGDDLPVFARPHIKCLLTQAYALAQKVPLARAHVLIGGAGHDVARRYRALPWHGQVLPLLHYKWETGIGARLIERFEHYQRLGLPHCEESALFHRRLQDGVDDLIVPDLAEIRLSIKRDKTGGTSLQVDPDGHLRFFRP